MGKIGILTYFGTLNPGTFLQAYCVQQMLKSRFPDDHVELVGYRIWKEYLRDFYRPNKAYISLRQWLKDYKKCKKYRNARRKYFTISSSSLVTQNSQKGWDFIAQQDYDLIVVGSDTVLEILPKQVKSNHVPVYWLPPSIKCKKVMCAASARSTYINQLSLKTRQILKEAVNDFELLGVRDDVTFSLIKSLGLEREHNLCMVPDPTFTFEIDASLADRYLATSGLNLNKPIVALHLTPKCKFGDKLTSNYRRRGYQVVSLGPARYADYCLTDVSQFEWAGLFSHFELVITHRFHDTVFSLKNFTPVISILPSKSFATPGGQSKHYSLLKLFGMHETNLISDIDSVDPDRIVQLGTEAKKHFKHDKVQKKLTELKENFVTFIDKIWDVYNNVGN